MEEELSLSAQAREKQVEFYHQFFKGFFEQEGMSQLYSEYDLTFLGEVVQKRLAILFHTFEKERSDNTQWNDVLLGPLRVMGNLLVSERDAHGKPLQWKMQVELFEVGFGQYFTEVDVDSLEDIALALPKCMASGLVKIVCDEVLFLQQPVMTIRAQMLQSLLLNPSYIDCDSYGEWYKRVRPREYMTMTYESFVQLVVRFVTSRLETVLSDLPRYSHPEEDAIFYIEDEVISLIHRRIEQALVSSQLEYQGKEGVYCRMNFQTDQEDCCEIEVHVPYLGIKKSGILRETYRTAGDALIDVLLADILDGILE